MSIDFNVITEEILASGPLTNMAVGWYFAGFTLHMIAMGLSELIRNGLINNLL